MDIEKAAADTAVATMMEKMCEDMVSVMKHPISPNMATGIATGAAISAGSVAKTSALSTIAKHPLVLLGLGIGLGVVAGYCLHQYRKDVISTAKNNRFSVHVEKFE